MNLIKRLKHKKVLKAISNKEINIGIPYDIIIDYPQNLTIDNNVKLGINNRLNAMSGINIENNVISSPNVFMWTRNHDYYRPDALQYGSKVIKKRIVIKDNV